MEYLSFPSKTKAVVLPPLELLGHAEGWLAVNKPPGINAFSDSRVGGGPGSIIQALQNRRPGRDDFSRGETGRAWPVNLLEREASGVFLCAKTEGERARLKNAMGSLQVRFVYHFLAKGMIGREELSCSLPLAFHFKDRRSFVTHRSGKKTETRFHRIADHGEWTLWEGVSFYDRFHQMRVHAAESGLALMGERDYLAARAGSRGSGLAPREANEKEPGDKPLLHLRFLEFPTRDGATVRLEAEYPPRFFRQPSHGGEKTEPT